MWDAGLAHRDIKPANLLVQGGHVRLIDTALTEVHSSPWRQAIDLANMMLVLALRSDPARVYQRARRLFTDQEIGEAFAATQGGAMPSQVRQQLRRSGDLRAELVRLLPAPPHPIRIQRWSARRVGLLVCVAALAAMLGATLASTFNNDLAIRTTLYVRNLGCSNLEPLWLEAQSVPSASLVPCVTSLPSGWRLANVAVNDGRSVITLDNDRFGAGAMVARLTAACDTSGAVQLPAAAPAVRRYQRVESSAGRFAVTWYDRFAGGCVTTRLTGPPKDQTQITIEAALVPGFTTREALRQALESRSGGRLHLDPGTAR